MCLKCAPDFINKGGVCIDTKIRDQQANLETTRYATYLGLSFATCIIFRKNVYIASVIGILVALYIGIAEYTVHDSDLPHPLIKAYKSWFK